MVERKSHIKTWKTEQKKQENAKVRLKLDLVYIKLFILKQQF